MGGGSREGRLGGGPGGAIWGGGEGLHKALVVGGARGGGVTYPN